MPFCTNMPRTDARSWGRTACAVVCGILIWTQASAHAEPPAHPGRETIDATAADRRGQWERRVHTMLRAGELRLRERRVAADGARDEWFDQMYKGVPIEGADVWRHSTPEGVTAIEGTIFNHVVLNPMPKLTRQDALDALSVLEPGTLGPSVPPALIVLPTADGKYTLVYKMRLLIDGKLVTYYLDASTGAVTLREDEER